MSRGQGEENLNLVTAPCSGHTSAGAPSTGVPILQELSDFREFGRSTLVRSLLLGARKGGRAFVPVLVNEFWTPQQRAANSLHEISYRACFKAQLPAFFIGRLTEEGDRVYDPFMGRGTTILEAALWGRSPTGCDINPLSRILIEPRLDPPTIPAVEHRLTELSLKRGEDPPRGLRAFYHPDTLRELCGLREYFLQKEESGEMDHVDRWLRMVAVNRLTGHSPGFFSVYTLPPNQAVSVASQRRINAVRGQVPPRREVRPLLLRKSHSLLRGVDAPVRARLAQAKRSGRFLTADAAHTPQLRSGSIDLVVTSPPFLDIVDYAQDNWLRCWFCGIEADQVPLTQCRSLSDWTAKITRVFRELHRALRTGGHIAFEVGEVRKGSLRLEETVLRCAEEAGLTPILVLIQDQAFTKTAHLWGVGNGAGGTNSNRVVLLRKDR